MTNEKVHTGRSNECVNKVSYTCLFVFNDNNNVRMEMCVCVLKAGNARLCNKLMIFFLWSLQIAA